MERAVALGGLFAAPLLIFSPQEDAVAGAETMRVKAFLCDSADHAIQFAAVMAKGESEEIAKARVGRLAKVEACGRYVGMATIESEQITLKGGTAYKVTAYRFREDHRLAWLAETTFAPISKNWDL